MSYSEISRTIPIEFTRGDYGFDANQLSSQAASSVDQHILQHENPNNCTDLAPGLPLDQYRLNVDSNPHVIRRKPQEKLQYLQEVAVRYLKPPQAPRGGDIVIQQLPSRQIAPAPPMIVRQAPPKPPTPPPVVIREAPPQPPAPLPGRTVSIPGKIIPPPARKVIVERLPPTPAKPQQVFIERWLPYGPQSQKIIYQPARAPCIVPDPKNIVIQWEAPDVDIRKEVKNLGVFETNPQEYISRYGSSLTRSDALPEIAIRYSQAQGLQLAANSRQEDLTLQGDVQALRLIDLDRNGLGYLRSRIGASMPNLASEALYSAESSAAASAAAAAAYGESYTTEAEYRSSPIQYESYQQSFSEIF